MEEELLELEEDGNNRLKDIVLVVGGAALIFYIGYRFGFKAGANIGGEMGNLVAKAEMLEMLLKSA